MATVPAVGTRYLVHLLRIRVEHKASYVLWQCGRSFAHSSQLYNSNSRTRRARNFPHETGHGCHASAVGFVFVETVWFRVEVLDSKNSSRYFQRPECRERLKFYEGDDRYFAATNAAGCFRTVIAGTAKDRQCVLLSPKSYLQRVIVQISEEHRGA